jgi:hypothetical protein
MFLWRRRSRPLPAREGRTFILQAQVAGPQNKAPAVDSRIMRAPAVSSQRLLVEPATASAVPVAAPAAWGLRGHAVLTARRRFFYPKVGLHAVFDCAVARVLLRVRSVEEFLEAL